MVVNRGYPPLRLILYKKIVVTFHTSNINIVHILTRIRVRVTLMEVTHIVLVKSNIVYIMVNLPVCMKIGVIFIVCKEYSQF